MHGTYGTHGILVRGIFLKQLETRAYFCSIAPRAFAALRRAVGLRSSSTVTTVASQSTPGASQSTPAHTSECSDRMPIAAGGLPASRHRARKHPGDSLYHSRDLAWPCDETQRCTPRQRLYTGHTRIHYLQIHRYISRLKAIKGRPNQRAAAYAGADLFLHSAQASRAMPSQSWRKTFRPNSHASAVCKLGGNAPAYTLRVVRHSWSGLGCSRCHGSSAELGAVPKNGVRRHRQLRF